MSTDFPTSSNSSPPGSAGQKSALAVMAELASGLDYPESPFWSVQDDCVYLVEWTGDRVSRFKAGGIERVFETGTGSGPCSVCQDSRGNFWVCLYSACQLVKYSLQGKILAAYDQHNGVKFKGPNDLCLDSAGGLYFTDSGDFVDDWISGSSAGKVFYLNCSGELKLAATEICYSNGVAISGDGSRLYVNEHRRNRVLVFDILGEGNLSESRVFCQLDDRCLLEPELAYELGPDGMCIDGNGNIWVAHFGGGKIVAIDPHGQILHKISLPRGRRPTNMIRCPGDNTLYITEAELGLLYQLALDNL
jgi:gluconolactonase